MSARFDGRVAIVTGAGQGLGRCHALGLAARGAKVVVSDLCRRRRALPGDAKGRRRDPGGRRRSAFASGADVTNPAEVAAMVARRRGALGPGRHPHQQCRNLARQDLRQNGVRRFRAVVTVHLIGAAIEQRGMERMRERDYGRILFTSSGSGLYGNFGQANYGAAKAAMIGLMNVWTPKAPRQSASIRWRRPRRRRMTAACCA